MTIAERIKNKRIEHDLLLGELGDRLGVSAQFISQLENGTKKLSIATLIGMCNVFNCSADEILGLNNAKKRKVG